MKSHIQRKNMQLSQEPLKRITKQIFKEYLLFIDYDSIDFPENVVIDIFNGYQSKEYNYGQLRIPDKENDLYVLSLEQLTVANKCKEILYHEFTHMMDFVVINNHISFDDRLHNFSFPSEVRAKHIEYLYRANFNNIKDNRCLTENSILLSDFTYKPIALKYEIEKHNAKILNEINEYIEQKFFDVMNQVYYYIGFLNFVEKHSDIIIDTTPVINALSLKFGNTIQQLFDLRKTIPLDFQPIELSTLMSIGNTVQLMYKYYIDNHLK